jgi:hypothetical protein
MGPGRIDAKRHQISYTFCLGKSMDCRVSLARTIHFPVFIFPFRINHLDLCAEEIEDGDWNCFYQKV